MRSGIAQVKGCQDVNPDLTKRWVSLKIQDKVSLQEVVRGIKHGGYDSQLLLQLKNSKADSKAVGQLLSELKKVKGVKSVSQPDKNGILSLTFNDKERTLLADLLNAAKKAGVELQDPKTS